MNKKLILTLVVFISMISIVNATYNQLVPSGLIPDPNSYLFSQLQQNPAFVEFFKTVQIGQTATNAIADPKSFITSQAFNQLDPKYQPLIQVSGDFMSYADESNIADYKLQMDDNGIVKEGEVVYKTQVKQGTSVVEQETEVNIKGVNLEKNGKVSCAEENCAVSIGKNTYTGVNPGSDLILDEDGKIERANFNTNKPTQMYFGDRAYNVPSNSNINYNLIKDGENEYYEVTIKSKEPVEFSFPELDTQGKPIDIKNYKISGEAKFSDGGLEIYEDTELEDTNLGYKIKNNGKEPIFITNKKENLNDKNNYLLANKEEFEFKLKEAELGINSNNKYGINLEKGEEIKINTNKNGGSGYLYENADTGEIGLKNNGGSFEIIDPKCGTKTINEIDIIEVPDEKNVESCAIIYSTKGGITTNGDNIIVCSEPTSGEEITLSFLKIDDITGMVELKNKEKSSGDCATGVCSKNSLLFDVDHEVWIYNTEFKYGLIKSVDLSKKTYTPENPMYKDDYEHLFDSYNSLNNDFESNYGFNVKNTIKFNDFETKCNKKEPDLKCKDFKENLNQLKNIITRINSANEKIKESADIIVKKEKCDINWVATQIEETCGNWIAKPFSDYKETNPPVIPPKLIPEVINENTEWTSESFKEYRNNIKKEDPNVFYFFDYDGKTWNEDCTFVEQVDIKAKEGCDPNDIDCWVDKHKDCKSIGKTPGPRKCNSKDEACTKYDGDLLSIIPGRWCGEETIWECSHILYGSKP